MFTFRPVKKIIAAGRTSPATFPGGEHIDATPRTPATTDGRASGFSMCILATWSILRRRRLTVPQSSYTYGRGFHSAAAEAFL